MLKFIKQLFGRRSAWPDKLVEDLPDGTRRLWTKVSEPRVVGDQRYDAEYACGPLRGTPSLPDAEAIKAGHVPRNLRMNLFTM